MRVRIFLRKIFLPMKVAKKYILNGIPTIGEARLTNHFGIIGVILTQSMYQKRFFLFLFIYHSLFDCRKRIELSREID